MLNRAFELIRQGAYPQAISLLMEAAAANPADLQCRLQLAKACLDWVQALARIPLAEVELGALSAEGIHHLQLAESQLEALSRMQPGSPHVQGLLAVVHLVHGRASDAERCLKKALSKDPAKAEYLYNAGYSQLQQQKSADATTLFRRLTALHPDHGPGWHMLGKTLQVACKPEAALGAFQRAIELLPGWAQPYGGMAYALRDLGRYDEAMAVLRRGLEKHPGNRDLNFDLSCMALSVGDWDTGWRHYVCRDESHPRPPLPHAFAYPLETGRPLRVLGDQGLGDELFFLRFTPVLAEQGFSVHYTTNARLLPLLQGDASITELKVADPDDESEAFDIRVSDLAYLAGMATSGRVPPPRPLAVDSTRAQRLRCELEAFGPGPYLGVTWRAGTPKQQGKKGGWRLLSKEAPARELGRLARSWPGSVVMLQRAPRSEEVDAFTEALGRPSLDWNRLDADLEEVLAGLSVLDEYVGVSNTNMHLLAGVGRTARVLVPHPPEWRWMAGGDESPWFPGFRIYRQSPGKDWGDALAELQRDLEREC